ncbi:MAG TPA: hypothetical protein VHY79_08415 [Rhizomicrobium sp.]|jgi:hypothetical protein|nr:hypothetical protein [Rhizomicrobium sp.]
MTESSSPHPAKRTRWRFFRDVLVLQLKLLAGNVHNFVLIPATLAAAFLDLIFKSDGHGARFYRVLEWGRRAEEAIGLYSALDADEDAVKYGFTVDMVVSQLEQVIVREYEKGATVAGIKTAVDRALDRLHR